MFELHGLAKLLNLDLQAQGYTGIHYHCGLNKCSAKQHSSLKAFNLHVETSHMKNVPLPCPFANCVPALPQFGRPARYYTFNRERELIGHLNADHADLLGCELDVRDSEKLLPSWEPRPPIRPLPAPPDLPSGTVSTASFRLEYVKPRDIRSWGWLARVEAEAESTSTSTNFLAPPSTPIPMPLTPVPKTPGGRRRLLHSPATQLGPPDGNTELEYDFADFDSVHYDVATRGMLPANIIAPPHFVVQPVGAGAGVELVHAPQMREVPVRERPPPPTSIFHEALRQQVYAQYASGEEAATDSFAIAQEAPS